MTLLVDAARELLVSSLTGRAAQMREDERRCRFAYSKLGPLRDSAIRLADVYARAAELFEQELALLDAAGFRFCPECRTKNELTTGDRWTCTGCGAVWIRGVDLGAEPAKTVVQSFGPCHPECMAAGMKLAFLHAERVPDPPVGTTASGGVLHAMNRGRAAVGMPPLVLEDLPAASPGLRMPPCDECGADSVSLIRPGRSLCRAHMPPPELVADPPEFPEGCKPTAKCRSGRLVYCKNCGGPTERNYDDGLSGNYESFNCADCRATTYVEIPI